MIGIVVVSHSPSLAQAAVDLALEMVGDAPPPIAIAAGAGDGVIGTDAVRVAEAIDEVATEDGALVFMDLGSAVLSGTMALEFATTGYPVRLSDAPFVEGLLAAVVLAGAGASLDEVAREASRALDSKKSQLGVAESGAGVSTGATSMSGSTSVSGSAGMSGSTSVSGSAGVSGGASVEVTLINPDGLHSRPAATIVKTVSGFDAAVTIENLTAGKPAVAANSLIGIMSLGAKEGDRVRIAATGAQAAEAVEALHAMAADGFGEVDHVN